MVLADLNKIVASFNGGKLRSNVPLSNSKLSKEGLIFFMFILHDIYNCFPYSDVKVYDFSKVTPNDLIKTYVEKNPIHTLN